MWLTYGLAADGALVEIDAVVRGKTDLGCPYCGAPLIAKKGQIKQPHFAHAGETCRAANRDDSSVPTLPLYQFFGVDVTAKELDMLRRFSGGGSISMPEVGHLVERGLATFNRFTYRHELTKRGKIPVGQLSLQLFCAEQEPRIVARLAELEDGVANDYARQSALLDEHLMDLRLYRAHLRRILSTTLYLFQITLPTGVIHKIGVTTRPVAERMAEVALELQRVTGAHVPVSLVDAWPHRGNVEWYFKHRYAAHRHPLGTLTEYFAFPDLKAVLRDLRRMPPKTFTEIEREVLAGEPAPIERQIAAERTAAARKAAHAAATRAGMRAVAAQGTHVGRPHGGEDATVFLAKPSSQRVLAALAQGLGVRAAARAAGVAINTVRKVQQLRVLDTQER
ncbi:GIY-YIG nuclease family protein [Chloroflexia bacterium SDU3-3]|nr:GIY-YIG nuclease family protein [Chloroflexia bacterium SDU3-3]